RDENDLYGEAVAGERGGSLKTGLFEIVPRPGFLSRSPGRFRWHTRIDEIRPVCKIPAVNVTHRSLDRFPSVSSAGISRSARVAGSGPAKQRSASAVRKSILSIGAL